MLYQITSSYYCAGLVVRNGYVAEAAPILKWAIGKTSKYVFRYFASKNYDVKFVSKE